MREIPIKTIGDLKQYLKRSEDSWTPMDEDILGKFDDQEIRVPTFSVREAIDPAIGTQTITSIKFLGYGDAVVIYDGGLGLVFEQAESKHGPTRKT